MGDDNPAWHRQQQTAKEFSAQEDNIVYGQSSRGVGAGNTVLVDLYTNSTADRQLLEMITIAQSAGYNDMVRYGINIEDSGGIVFAELDMNPAQLPLVFDPAAPIPPGGSVSIDVENDSSVTVTAVMAALVRVIN